jgi:hypothetical protein
MRRPGGGSSGGALSQTSGKNAVCFTYPPIFLRLAERTRAHAFVVMLAYHIIQYLALCWSTFDLTVEEGLHALATLSLVEVSPHNASSSHCIPTPRDAIAQLLHCADIKLPHAFALSGTRVSTKKKLQSERLAQ